MSTLLELAPNNTVLVLSTGDVCMYGLDWFCQSLQMVFDWFALPNLAFFFFFQCWWIVRKATAICSDEASQRSNRAILSWKVREVDILIQEEWLLMTGKDANNAAACYSYYTSRTRVSTKTWAHVTRQLHKLWPRVSSPFLLPQGICNLPSVM